jgi:hypothetical protein
LLQIDMPRFYLTHVMRAIVYAELGDMENARTALDDLTRLKPDYGRSVRDDFTRRNLPRALDREDHRRPAQGRSGSRSRRELGEASCVFHAKPATRVMHSKGAIPTPGNHPHPAHIGRHKHTSP